MVSTTNLGTFRVAADIELEVHICGSCGVTWGMTAGYLRARRNDHEGWVCPNGHSWVFAGPSEEQKLRDRLARTESALAGTQDRLNEVRREAEHERARANGYKGVVVKTKKRLANGVCPYCNRSGFVQLGRHVNSKHPGEPVPA